MWGSNQQSARVQSLNFTFAFDFTMGISKVAVRASFSLVLFSLVFYLLAL